MFTMFKNMFKIPLFTNILEGNSSRNIRLS